MQAKWTHFAFQVRARTPIALFAPRRMLSLALDWEIINYKPRIRLRKEVERTAVFDADMEERLLKVAHQPLRDVFLISHDSGLRPEAVIRMRWENVLWKKNLIFVPHGKTEQAKRYMPLSRRVRDVLLERKASPMSEWVFPSPKKRSAHVSYFPIAKQFAKPRKDANIPRVSCSTRHATRSRRTCWTAPATLFWLASCSAIAASQPHNAICIRR